MFWRSFIVSVNRYFFWRLFLPFYLKVFLFKYLRGPHFSWLVPRTHNNRWPSAWFYKKSNKTEFMLSTTWLWVRSSSICSLQQFEIVAPLISQVNEWASNTWNWFLRKRIISLNSIFFLINENLDDYMNKGFLPVICRPNPLAAFFVLGRIQLIPLYFKAVFIIIFHIR